MLERAAGLSAKHGVQACENVPGDDVVGLAQTAEIFASAFGVDAAVEVIVERRGRWFDPSLVDAFRSLAEHDAFWAKVLGRSPERHLNTLEPDESLDAGAERVDAATWGKVSRTYVRLARDLSIPLALQDRFIREADALTPDNPFDVRTLDSSHVGFLIHPEEAAALLTG